MTETKGPDDGAQRALEAAALLGAVAGVLADDGQRLPKRPRTATYSVHLPTPICAAGRWYKQGSAAAPHNIDVGVQTCLCGLTGKYLCYWRLLTVNVATFTACEDRSVWAIVTIVAEQCRKDDATPCSDMEYWHPLRSGERPDAGDTGGET